MWTVLIHEGGTTRKADAIDRAWLAPDSPVIVWADIQEPEEAERQILADVFRFHELSVENAMAAVHIEHARSLQVHLTQ